jgi:hypothetical protein
MLWSCSTYIQSRYYQPIGITHFSHMLSVSTALWVSILPTITFWSTFQSPLSTMSQLFNTITSVTWCISVKGFISCLEHVYKRVLRPHFFFFLQYFLQSKCRRSSVQSHSRHHQRVKVKDIERPIDFRPQGRLAKSINLLKIRASHFRAIQTNTLR